MNDPTTEAADMPQTHLLEALQKLLGLPGSFTALRLTWAYGDAWPTVEVTSEVQPFVVVDTQLQEQFHRFKCVPVGVDAPAPSAGDHFLYTDRTMIEMLRQRQLPGVAMWVESLLSRNHTLEKDLAHARRINYQRNGE